MKMIELHLAGHRNIEIAEAFNTSPSRVSITLHNPTAQAYLDTVREAVDQELKSLLPTAVEAIRRALRDDDIHVALRPLTCSSAFGGGIVMGSVPRRPPRT